EQRLRRPRRAGIVRTNGRVLLAGRTRRGKHADQPTFLRACQRTVTSIPSSAGLPRLVSRRLAAMPIEPRSRLLPVTRLVPRGTEPTKVGGRPIWSGEPPGTRFPPPPPGRDHVPPRAD